MAVNSLIDHDTAGWPGTAGISLASARHRSQLTQELPRNLQYRDYAKARNYPDPAATISS